MLPIPTEKEIEEFRKICRKRFIVELTDEQAIAEAMLVLQISYVRQYGLLGEKRRQALARLFRENVHSGQGELRE